MTTEVRARPSVGSPRLTTAWTAHVEAAVRRFVHTRLGAHAIALAVVLLALVPLFDKGGIAISDEGLYSAQAAYLADGSWSAPRPMASVDRDGRGDVLRSETIVGDRHIPYSRHALYPLVLAVPYKLAGTIGLLLVSTVSVWAAAVLSGRLAADIDPRAGPLALWLVGVGCPLIFDAYLVSGHATAAALVAAMFVALHRVEATPRPVVWWAAAVVAGAGAALLRSEAVIVVGMIGLVIVGSALVRRPRLHVVRGRAVGGAAVGAAAVTAHLADEWIDGRITRGATAATGSGNRFDRGTDLVDSMWNDLLKPWTNGPIEARASIILALVAVVLAGLAARAMQQRPLLPVSLVVMAAIAAALMLTETPLLIGGLLPAFPVAVLGWSALPATAWRDPRIVRMAATIVLSAGGIAATTYGEGGIGQWGGRFYHLLLPIVAVPAVVGLIRLGRSFDGGAPSVIAAAVVVLTLSFSVLALRANLGSREYTRTLREEVASVAGWIGDDRSSTAPELVVFSTTRADGRSRAFSRDVIDGRPIVSSAGIFELPPTLERALEVGVDDVLVVTDLPLGSPDLIVAERAGDRWRVADWQWTRIRGVSLIRLVAVDRSS